MAQAASIWVKLGLIDKNFAYGLKKAEKNIKKFGDRMNTLGMRITQGISLPFAAAGAASVKMAADMETAQVALTTLMGTASAATEQMAQLKQFAASTPFQFTELLSATRRMMAFGFQAKETIPILRNLGNASFALGQGAEGVNNMILALGQMRMKGRAQSEEMTRQLGQYVGAWQYLADYLQTNVKTAMSMVEKRMIDGETAVKAVLLGIANDPKFKDGMAKQVKTLMGQWSNFKDQLAFTLADIGGLLIQTFDLKGVINNVRSAIKAFSDWFAKLDPGLRKAIANTALLAATLGPILIIIGKISLGWSALIPIFGKTIGLIKGIGTAFAAMAAGQAAATTATARLAASFAPFLIGSSIIAGLTIIVDLIKKMRENARVDNLKIGDIKNLDDAQKKAKSLDAQIERLQNRKKAATTKDTKGGWLAGGIGGWSDTDQQELKKLMKQRETLNKVIQDFKPKSKLKPKVTQNLLSSVGPLTLTGKKDERTSTDVYKSFTKNIADAKSQSDIFGDSFDLLEKQVNLAESAITELVEMGLKPEDKILADIISKYQGYIQQQKNEVNIQGQIQERMNAETEAWKRRQAQIDAEIKKQEDIKAIYNSLDSEMKEIANTEKTFGDGYDELSAKTDLYKSALLSLIGAGEFGTEKFNELLLVYQKLNAEQKDFIDKTEGAKEAEKALSDATEYLNSLTNEAIPDYEQFAKKLEKIADKKGVLAETGNELRKMADAIRQAGKGVVEKQAAKDFSESIYGDTHNALVSAFEDAFENGKGFASSFADYLGDVLKQKVYKSMADAILNSPSGQSFTSSFGNIASGIFGKTGTAVGTGAGAGIKTGTGAGAGIKTGTGAKAGTNAKVGSVGKALGAAGNWAVGSAMGGMGTGAMLGSALGMMWGPTGSMLGGMLGGLFDSGGKKDSLSVTSDNAKMNIDFAEANFKTITLPASYQQIGKTSNTNSVAPIINVNVNVPGGINGDRELERRTKKIATAVASGVQKVAEKWSPYTVNGVNSSLMKGG
jgi:tape measure domain-containing protein